MKKITGIFLAIICVACIGKSEKENKNAIVSSQDNNAYEVRLKDSLENSGMNILKDNPISTKEFRKEQDSFILNYKYPYLDEQKNALYYNFNKYIEETYITNENSVKKVLDNNSLSCDPVYENTLRKKRSIDYKIYAKNNHFLSILLYKTNYYDNKEHNSFMFNGLNYDLESGSFITYKDVFKDNSEEFLFFKLNQELDARIAVQDSFTDCWKFDKETFKKFKGNFVMNAAHIKFYFDDCIICPTYSGNYFLEIPWDELEPVLKTNDIDIPFLKS